ncbi:MAG: hypothetical protein U9N81_15150 [Bacillota bacterium]|nr:hypothetical protein [Bacillota bacterium]
MYRAKQQGRNQVKANLDKKVLLLGPELNRNSAVIHKKGIEVVTDPNEASIVIADVNSVRYAPDNVPLYVLGTGSIVDWGVKRIRPDAIVHKSLESICDVIIGVKEKAQEKDIMPSVQDESDTESVDDSVKTSKLSVLPGVRSGNNVRAQTIPKHGAIYVTCLAKPAEAAEMAVKLCQSIEKTALICAAPDSRAGLVLKIPTEKLIVSDWRMPGAEAPVQWMDITVWPVDPFKHLNIAKKDEIETLIDAIKSRFALTVIDCGSRLDLCSRIAGDEGVLLVHTDGDSSDIVADQWSKTFSTGKVITMSPTEVPEVIIGDNGFVISPGQISAQNKQFN